MSNIKNLFATPRKAVLSSLCILAILAGIGVGTVFAAGAFAESSAIGAENAQKFAFADAGVDPAAAQVIRTEFDYEQGQFVYEVEFIADGAEYEYWIRSTDGAVVKKEQEVIFSDGSSATAVAQITLDEAKNAALADAGLAADAVVFTKQKLDLDDGLSVYDIEFYTDDFEYDYEINAADGSIYSRSKESVTTPTTPPQSGASQSSSQSANAQSSAQSSSQASSQTGATQQQGSGLITLDEAKSKAIADAGVEASAVTYTKAKLDYDDGRAVYDIDFYTSASEYEYEIDAATGAVRERKAEAFQGGAGPADGTSVYIGVDKAKSIAVGHAGFSVADVTFSKAKLENDDGYTVYEIEFYKDAVEYDYTVNAATGAVMEFDSDYND